MFGKKNNDKIKNSIELVSMHIPKTAGTSFRNILKDHYGSRNAVRLDINITNKRIDVENQPYTQKKLPANIRVIHGHFYYNDLVDLFDLKPDVKFITWLRDPVDRVISNYYYLAKRLQEELDEEAKGLNILAKMQKSLIEYARAEISRNRMYKFLEGTDLGQFHFVGLTEYYAEDMQTLCRELGIDNYEVYAHNITGKKEAVGEEIVAEIAALNSMDVALYEQALALRNRRINTEGI